MDGIQASHDVARRECVGSWVGTLHWCANMSAEITAFLLLAVSGLFQAAFAIPIKHLRNWRWEQVWVAQSVMANILLPLAWAAVVPGVFWDQASRVPLSHWVAAYGWGLVWGLGGVTYGLTLTRLGVAFANSFVFGVTIVTGALIPLALHVVATPPHPLRFGAGLILCVVATGLIGLFRSRGGQTPLLPTAASLHSYRRVVPIAIVSGIASAGYGRFAGGGTASVSGRSFGRRSGWPVLCQKVAHLALIRRQACGVELVPRRGDGIVRRGNGGLVRFGWHHRGPSRSQRFLRHFHDLPGARR